jgi:hypothetical protein
VPEYELSYSNLELSINFVSAAALEEIGKLDVSAFATPLLTWQDKLVDMSNPHCLTPQAWFLSFFALRQPYFAWHGI